VEKKSIEISQVEAIEKERAQTESFGRCGVLVW